jgi:hypothetical protein
MEKAEIEEWIEYVNGQTEALSGKIYDDNLQELYDDLKREYEKILDETGIIAETEGVNVAGELKERLHSAFHNFHEAFTSKKPTSGGYKKSRKNRSRKQQRKHRAHRGQKEQKKRQTRNRK